jgi:hypothetical protein
MTLESSLKYDVKIFFEIETFILERIVYIKNKFYRLVEPDMGETKSKK